MRRYKGNEKVEAGIYLNPRQVSFKSMDGEARLPGCHEDRYLRVPTLALVAAGPALGLTYVILLPFIGFAMLAWVAGGRLMELTGQGAAAAVSVLKPAWRPAMAFLSRGKTVKRVDKHEDAWAENVKRELERPHDDPA
jgi:hypothetical protein